MVEVKRFVLWLREGMWLRLKGELGRGIIVKIYFFKRENKVYLRVVDVENKWWLIGVIVIKGVVMLVSFMLGLFILVRFNLI